MRHRAIDRLNPTDKLRRWGADCNEGCDQRGMEVEQTWGDKCGFKRLCDTMVVTTEGARMVIGRVVGAVSVNNRLTGV